MKLKTKKVIQVVRDLTTRKLMVAHWAYQPFMFEGEYIEYDFIFIPERFKSISLYNDNPIIITNKELRNLKFSIIE